jgi:hypothetical protein
MDEFSYEAIDFLLDLRNSAANFLSQDLRWTNDDLRGRTQLPSSSWRVGPRTFLSGRKASRG